jgi:hypothetical protein
MLRAQVAAWLCALALVLRVVRFRSRAVRARPVLVALFVSRLAPVLAPRRADL